MDLTGTLVTGMGKAAGFVQSYTPLFQERLGITPFPGTLNIRVKTPPLLRDGVQISPPSGGGVTCWDVIVNKKARGFLIRPAKTTHPPEIIEIISPVNLTEYFSLKQGDQVQVRIV